MEKRTFAIGLMSGTSLDGVDLVYVEFSSEKETYQYKILQAKTYAYSEEWYFNLKNAFHQSEIELLVLHKTYGKYLGDLVNEFRKEFKIETIDFIASHGHTIFHKPDEGYTLQIGCGEEISRINNCKVVYDFRSQDVAMGGQGAPLVPIGDQLLFANYTYCLNLGGFANISFEENGIRKAFDICPVNIVMNHYMQQIGKPYDDKGLLAASGKIHEPLLEKLNKDPFYSLPFPKSLGFEFVVKNVLPCINLFELPLQNVLRTFIEHVALKISEVLQKNASAKILITGGGAYNEFLLERIQSMTSVEIVVPEKEVVEFKEALIFAFLGLLKIEGKINCLKSVTGASSDHSSGKIIIAIN